jgi:hypothetical protein
VVKIIRHLLVRNHGPAARRIVRETATRGPL